jgi:hypothetical protein
MPIYKLTISETETSKAIATDLSRLRLNTKRSSFSKISYHFPVIFRDTFSHYNLSIIHFQ